MGDYSKLTTYAGAIVENTLWFSARECNGLFKMDLSDCRTHFVKAFPECDTNFYNQHIKAIQYHNQLIFIPMYGSYIHLYGIKSDNISCINVGAREKYTWYVRDAFLLEDHIYMIPYDMKNDLKVLDIKSRRITTDKSFRNSCMSYLREALYANDDKGIISAKCFLEGNKLYFSVFPYKIIGCYDFITRNINFRQTDIGKIFGLYINDGVLFVLSSDDIRIHGIKNGGFGKEYVYESNIEYSNLDGEHRPYLSMLQNEKGFFVIPAYGREFLQLKNESFKCVSQCSEWADGIPDNKLLFYSIITKDNHLILPSLLDSNIYMFDNNMQFERKIALECNDSKYSDYRKLFDCVTHIKRKKGSFICESDNFSLKWFVKSICINDSNDCKD